VPAPGLEPGNPKGKGFTVPRNCRYAILAVKVGWRILEIHEVLFYRPSYLPWASSRLISLIFSKI
jgi:hypothetical protein